MPNNKTNQERITDNNAKIDTIKTKVNNLPDYQDLTKQTAIQTNVYDGKTFYDNSGKLVIGTGPQIQVIKSTITNSAEVEGFSLNTYINSNIFILNGCMFGLNDDKSKIYIKVDSEYISYNLGVSVLSLSYGCLNTFLNNTIILVARLSDKFMLIQYNFQTKAFEKLTEIEYEDVVDEVDSASNLLSLTLNPTRNLIAMSMSGNYYIFEIQNDYTLRRLYKNLITKDNISYYLCWKSPYVLNVGSTGLIADLTIWIYNDLTTKTVSRTYGSASTTDPYPISYNLEGTYCAKGKGKPSYTSSPMRGYYCTGAITIYKCTTTANGVTTVGSSVSGIATITEQTSYRGFNVTWFNETTLGISTYNTATMNDTTVYIYTIDKSTNKATLIGTYSRGMMLYSSYLYDRVLGDYYQVKLDGETYITGAYIDNGLYGTSTDTTAVAGDLLSGKTAYSKNEIITGTMSNNGTLNYTPTTSQQTIPQGYTSGGTIGAVTSAIDSNIQAENIKKDVEILGVTGTLKGTELVNVVNGGVSGTTLVLNSVPYVELEYIESTGEQYIKTDYKASYHTKIVVKVQSAYSSGITTQSWYQVTGAKSSYHSTDAIQLAVEVRDNIFVIDYGNSGVGNGVIDANVQPHIIEIAYGEQKGDGVLLDNVTGSFKQSGVASYPLWIFDCNDGGRNENKSKIKLYSYKLYEDDVLTMNLIPVKIKATNERCLYDTVTNTYFKNQGTGTFIAGPEKE